MAFPPMFVQIAFGTPPLSGTPTWTGFSEGILEASIRRGRQHELDRFEAGQATITLDNSGGQFWPNNAGGSLSPNVLPGKRLRLRALWSPSFVTEFEGFIEDWEFGFRSAPGTKLPTTTITAVDGMAKLAAYDLEALVCPQELAGSRVARVLDALGWPSNGRVIDSGQSQMQAGTITAKALDHLDTVMLSELGLLYQQRDDDIQFRDRHARLKAPYLTSLGTVGDGAGELPYQDVEFEFSDQQVYNTISVTRAGGSAQTSSDATSQDTYGKRSLTKDGLFLTSDAEAKDQADYLKSRYKDAALRVKSIGINPAVDEDNWYPQVLARDLSARITVRLDCASIDKDYFIEGIEHRVTGKSWRTKWWLSPCDVQEYWTLGVSRLGTGTRLAY